MKLLKECDIKNSSVPISEIQGIFCIRNMRSIQVFWNKNTIKSYKLHNELNAIIKLYLVFHTHSENLPEISKYK